MNLLHGRHRLASIALIVASTTATQVFAQEMAKPTLEMQAALDKLRAPKAKPFSTLTVPKARTQASPADAAKVLQWNSSNPQAQVNTKDVTIPSLAGGLAVRVFITGRSGPFTVVVYYHGGGWVVANINVYDGAPRTLAMGPNAIVVSVEYRNAPDHGAKRIALAGESAGGNVAVIAKEQEMKLLAVD
ncbi:alpha/beta hydrolase fold domain-containing protein [Rhizobium sp. RM]|uniref:alpha/beta hydrolase fold domain-containing protein n=1 Tax=Rhizobium sp. RM TaxID=2748079 RepID=UPI00110E39A7|nr:alpha/beta hydrolase fold domain-containing protein [Rhizobium sp. RM]NWJ27587.1 alpha/beta hydrolase fold domain-containing protein [Rhizobium sp. RM]TMV19959.1 alpha/beta hydrolase [Rhizobium sp. Td3]